MSSDDDESKLKILKFSGKDKEWREWSGKFLSQATLKGYKMVLFNKTPDGTKIEIPKDDEVLDETTEEGKNKAKLRKLNSKAYCMLKLSCSKVAYNLVEEAVTEDLPDGCAALAWTKLHDKYAATEVTDKVMLKKEFNNRALKAHEDPDKWFLDLEHLRRRLLDMKAPVSDLDTMAHILNNMGSKYDELVTIIEGQMDSDFTLEMLKKRIRGYYKRQSKGSGDESDDEDEAALVGFKGRCRKCGKFGHKAADCKNSGNSNNNNYNKKEPRGPKITGKCSWCGKVGHIEKFCWAKKKGQPKVEGEAANFGNSNNGGASPGICLLITQHDSDVLDDDIWIADSGASSHMTYSKDGMFDIEEVEEQVTLGNNHVVQGLMRGKLQVQLDTMDDKTTVQLTNVLYVPELCYNLFSVGVIANMGGKVSFGSDSILSETS